MLVSAAKHSIHYSICLCCSVAVVLACQRKTAVGQRSAHSTATGPSVAQPRASRQCEQALQMCVMSTFITAAHALVQCSCADTHCLLTPHCFSQREWSCWPSAQTPSAALTKPLQAATSKEPATCTLECLSSTRPLSVASATELAAIWRCTGHCCACRTAAQLWLCLLRALHK
jgi:hypothetical protein